MSKFNVKLMVAALVLSIGAIANVGAQVEPGTTLKFFVADDFVINGTSFAAGEYTVERTPNTVDSPSLLIIRGEKSMVFDTMVADSRTVADRTELIFENVGGVNYLSAITTAGQTSRNELLSAKAQMK
ncbi:MAG TPA: hypothetical protein PLK77_07665 [Pyrinomonadaceae bacterium]|nr:hypothetical protein [Pyrinomonadaceae bacterium]